MKRVGLKSLLVFCGLSIAATATAQEAGTAARLGLGARPLALGGAFVAVPDDAVSTTWNPAALATVRSTRVQLHYRRLDAQQAVDAAHLVFGPARRGMVWGASLTVLHRDGVPAEDALGGGFSGTPGATELSGLLSVAAQPVDGLSLGISGGPIVSSYDTQAGRTTGWGGNAGMLWQHGGTAVGFGILGVTAGLGTEAVPQTYRYRLSTGMAQRFGDTVLAAVQFDRDRGADPRWTGGLEWTVLSSVHLRGGVQHWTAEDDQSMQVFSNGLGVERGRFRMDYGVRYASNVRPEHLLSLRFRLGGDAPTLQDHSEPLAEDTSAPPHETGRVHIEPSRPQAQPTTRSAAPQRAPASQATPVQPVRPSTATPSPTQSAPAPTPAATPPARRTLPVGGRDGLPAPPRPQGATTLSVPSATQVTYVVRAGVHADMDDAALEIARFYRAKIRPDLEKRGSLFVVVVKRCKTLEEAQEWVQRAKEADLRCTIDEE